MEGDWERLGAAVRRERIRAGFRSIDDFAKAVEARTGHYLSSRTVANLERGVRVNDRSLQLVSDALQWPTEAVKDILGGGLVYVTYIDAATEERRTRSLTHDTEEDLERQADVGVLEGDLTRLLADGSLAVLVESQDEADFLTATLHALRQRRSPRAQPLGEQEAPESS